MAIFSPLFADQAVYVNRSHAKKLVDFVKKGDIIYHFCAPCGDASPKSEYVNSIGMKGRANETTVKINQNEIDLAYIYIKNLTGRWENAAMFVGFQTSSVPRYIDPQSQNSLKIQSDKDNILSGRLEGVWETNRTLSRKLTGRDKIEIEAIRFDNSTQALSKFPERAEKYLKDHTIYMAGDCTFIAKGKRIDAEFLVTSHKGNPFLVLNINGNTEGLYVAIAVAKNRGDDILFLGGDHATEPYTPMERTNNTNLFKSHSVSEPERKTVSPNNEPRHKIPGRPERLSRPHSENLSKSCYSEAFIKKGKRMKKKEQQRTAVQIKVFVDRWPDMDAQNKLSAICPITIIKFKQGGN